MAETAVTLVNACSYAATGNVLKIQEMLHICSEHASTKKAAAPTTEESGAAEVAAADKAAATATAEAGAGATNAQDVDMDGADETTPLVAPEGRAATVEDAPAEGADAATPAPAPEAAPAADAAPEEEESEPKPLKHQAAATIGIALIAMGEEVGAEMALRQFQHLVCAYYSIWQKPLTSGN